MNRAAIEAEMNMGPLAFLSQIADTYEEEGDADMAKAYRVIYAKRRWPHPRYSGTTDNWSWVAAGDVGSDYTHHCVSGTLSLAPFYATLSAAYEALAREMVRTNYLRNYEADGNPKKRPRKPKVSQ